jgi:hypothetical protein
MIWEGFQRAVADDSPAKEDGGVPAGFIDVCRH